MEEAGLMETIGLILSLAGEGQSLADLFGGGGPDIEGLIDRLERDIKQVFRQDLADEAVREASSVAQSSADWLSIDYRNAVVAGESQAELWALLDASSDSPGLNALKVQAGIMVQWASGNPDAIAQQTASLALMIYGLIAIIHRERSLRAPDAPTRQAEAASMRDYAQRGFERVFPLYTSFRTARFGGISSPALVDADSLNSFWIVSDSWVMNGSFPGSSPLFSAFVNPNFMEPAIPDPQTQINGAYTAYLQLLRSGADSDAETLTTALSSQVTAFVGEGPFFVSPSGADLIANYLPGFQATGKWLASAPKALQSLRKIAGMIDYEVAYQGAANGSLCTAGKAPPNDWMLGVMNGTVPSIVGTSDGGYFISFQDSDGLLRHAGTGGNGPDNLPLAPGTSPSVLMLPDGSFRSWYQRPGGHLTAVTAVPQPVGKLEDYGLQMMASTSPDAALLPGGGVIVAFQGAGDGKLWTAGATMAMSNVVVRVGSSPSIAILADGSWLVAFAADADGSLVTWDANGAAGWKAKIADGTSPSIAASGDGNFRIVFQGTDGMLQFAEPGGAVTATSEKMMPGTSPCVTALAVGGFQTAFQAADGQLVAMGDSNPLPTGLAVHPGASPGIAALVPEK